MPLPVAVPTMHLDTRRFKPCVKSTPTTQGTYVSPTSTGTYSAKLKFHGDNTLLGISRPDREFQE